MGLQAQTQQWVRRDDAALFGFKVQHLVVWDSLSNDSLSEFLEDIFFLFLNNNSLVHFLVKMGR